MSKSYNADLPRFQQLQVEFSAHIRDPKNQPYTPQNQPGLAEMALDIAPNRMAAYESLFFNNLSDFFSNLFPVCQSVLGDQRWQALIREYMQKHHAQTPLFHELGQEFLLFLQNEYQPHPEDPAFLLELAHYEWIELALLVSEQEGLYLDTPPSVNLDKAYSLSAVAIPLAYRWPVDQISAENILVEAPAEPTTLLAYRDAADAVQFMTLTPLLYDLLMRLDVETPEPMLSVVARMAEELQMSTEDLAELARPAIDGLLQQQVLIPCDAL